MKMGTNTPLIENMFTFGSIYLHIVAIVELMGN